MSQGCNSIGCDATAVCTIDLPNCQSVACQSFAAICGPAQQAAAAPQAGFAGQANLRPSFVDCSIVCPTRIGPCLSQHVTCAAICTQFTPCLPTRFSRSARPRRDICTSSLAIRLPDHQCRVLPDCVGRGVPAGQSRLPAAEPGVRRYRGSSWKSSCRRRHSTHKAPAGVNGPAAAWFWSATSLYCTNLPPARHTAIPPAARCERDRSTDALPRLASSARRGHHQRARDRLLLRVSRRVGR